ncbi:MAG TPA: DCC1-like thiol-disulfide oxidoreductase family protein [Chitinophagaceae bacterium]|nr:DCC1-like thiol-disulfide oxidoreductase family protein [Chitinophagaceae bacterium]
METKLLIYDDLCPLCSWYSGLFTQYGFLPQQGRMPFSQLDPVFAGFIDLEKAKDEIPLLDTSTRKVLYGIDALLAILGKRFPVIKRLGHFPPLYWFLKRVYRFISYNRKVIVARKCGRGLIDCSPSVNYFYRFAFMLVFLLFNTIMLFPLHKIVLSRLPGFELNIVQLQAAHFTLVAINCFIALGLDRHKAVEYLGQVNMLALLTILLLLPILGLCSLLEPEAWFTGLYFITTSLIIFSEYSRRMDYAGILPGKNWVAGLNYTSIMIFLMVLFN